MSKINISKLVVDNYSTEDVIAFLSKESRLAATSLADALEDNCLAAAGCQTANIIRIADMLQLLDEKLNGKKEATVVQ